MKFASLFLVFTLLYAAHAFDFTPLEFTRKDWMLACDNTGACKMAGYQSEDEDNSVSVMFERKAGEGFKGYFKAYDPNLIVDKDDTAQLFIGGVKKAEVKFSPSKASELNKEATDALLEALLGTSKIEFKLGGVVWRLSSAGYNAVLLKANAHQGYSKSGSFLKPNPKPVIKAAKVIGGLRVIGAKDSEYERVRKLLQSVNNADECEALFDGSLLSEITVSELTKELSVVSSLCQAGAYNFTDAIIITDNKLTQIKQNLGAEYDGYDGGVLSAMQKIRGAGDCWYYKEAVWDGAKFELAREGTTGLCKGFAGGAWRMDTFVSEVIK